MAPIVKLTKGQAAFLRAVLDGKGGMFNRRVIEPLEQSGQVYWIGGMRLVGCNAFSASNFVGA